MPSLTQIRVRYKDTDTMSVVYYGNYLTYFEVGRVEYLREKSLPMSLVNQRIHMPVVEAFVKYVKPAKLDDLLEVVSRVSERRRASFTFSYEIRNESRELVATGFTRHAENDCPARLAQGDHAGCRPRPDRSLTSRASWGSRRTNGCPTGGTRPRCSCPRSPPVVDSLTASSSSCRRSRPHQRATA